MKLPQNPSDRQLRRIIKRSARLVGLPESAYAYWMAMDPEGAADELALAIREGRDPARAKQRLVVAFKKDPASMERFTEWQKDNPCTHQT